MGKRGLMMGIVLFMLNGCVSGIPVQAADTAGVKLTREALKERIDKLVPDPAFPDDIFALVTIKEAYTALSSGSGGIGACLVDERTQAVIELGRNRQYTGYFRSDLHAEMDLLTRYEDRLKKLPAGKGGNPRACTGLVLYTSVEPCPMCLTRIINAGIKKVYYVAPDEDGGMVSRLDSLPPFWRRFAADRTFAQARCSEPIQQAAADLFQISIRNFKPK